ncbi:predicted protein [Uncinocarpus reesii 1704]|uniref:Uncharacterized protein n=1 Tax=Uncinocarpus reesii (strain UAMH 1704) TaxID=336963 RepID=C4JX47_UNCRE|nr:uncharacterized protein UREG_06220 [Uncinocarpus reesii 1704]EEP81355.1 predicted protein [Uncinocarpus reesii 1704]
MELDFSSTVQMRKQQPKKRSQLGRTSTQKEKSNSVPASPTNTKSSNVLPTTAQQETPGTFRQDKGKHILPLITPRQDDHERAKETPGTLRRDKGKHLQELSSKETVDDMKVIEARWLNEEVLLPRSRAAGYISVTEKTEEGLKIEFDIVQCAEEGDPVMRPALGEPAMSTVYLNEHCPLDGPEEVFRAFLAACIKFLPVV